MAVGIPTCESSFRDCYTKCFIFCVIEPSQSLCSCTTRCLKECIFSELTKLEASDNENSDNLGFCKLGCSFSACSTMSTILKPMATDKLMEIRWKSVWDHAQQSAPTPTHYLRDKVGL
ncbi:thionin-like protein 1 [Primulina eburnea]|uniref:thionin-like protein 1 n=1 Tax=Primulina eburnea TaxID=1245227 RepID=UPI003C6C4411